MKSLDESLKLFEQETVLSVRTRKVQLVMFDKSDDDQIKLCLESAKTKPFDLSHNIHKYKIPDMKEPGLSSS